MLVRSPDTDPTHAGVQVRAGRAQQRLHIRERDQGRRRAQGVHPGCRQGAALAHSQPLLCVGHILPDSPQRCGERHDQDSSGLQRYGCMLYSPGCMPFKLSRNPVLLRRDLVCCECAATATTGRGLAPALMPCLLPLRLQQPGPPMIGLVSGMARARLGSAS